jgi:hypothetical protein
MLVAAVAHTSDASLGSDVIDAIVGGTMLTLALSRPQLRWIQKLTRGYRSRRRWAERALTCFSFAMGGYAAAAVWLTLYGQLGSETDALLKGAAYFLAIYAGLVHFEPFVIEWDLNKGFGVVVLYLGVAFSTTVVGAAIATLTLTSSAYLDLIWTAVKVFVASGVVSWLIRSPPKPNLILDRGKRLIIEAIGRPTADDEAQ